MAQITLNSTGVASNGTLALQSNGTTTAVTIDASQNVGIGTASPASFGRFVSKQSADTSIAALGVVAQASTTDTFISIGYGSASDTCRIYSSYLSTGAFKPISFWTSDAERMRIDSSGNVGIGTSSPATRLHVAGSTTATSQVTTQHTGSAVTTVFGCDGGIDAGAVYVTTNHPLAFRTNNTERARIDSSGNLLVGKTTTNNDVQGLVLYPDGQMRMTTNGTASNTIIGFFRNSSATLVGSINTTSTATSYVTSSDYRLKENIQPMTGALAKVAALKPVTYTWKSTGEADEGFIAHELQEVCPSAVVGEKDAVDAEGNPQYQGIDTSFLAGLYAAALQELKTINDAQAQTIESLTARVVALEQA